VARSVWIYVVADASGPVAAFTVKHELAWWLKRQPGDRLPHLHVFRCRDNPAWPGDTGDGPADMTLEVIG
jgi:hypothetical protein